MRIPRLVLGASLAVVVALLGGCPSYLAMQSSRTADPGTVELSGAIGKTVMGVGLGVSQDLQPIPAARGPTQLEGAVRFGIVDNLDMGFRIRLNDLGVAGGLKLRFLNLDSFQMAIAGEVGTGLWAPLLNSIINALDQDARVFTWWVDVPLLMGIPLDNDYLVTFGPKVKITNYSVEDIYALLDGDAGTSVTISSTQVQPGIMAGVEVPVGDQLIVFPEVDFHFDLVTRSFLLQVGATATFIAGSRKQ